MILKLRYLFILLVVFSMNTFAQTDSTSTKQNTEVKEDKKPIVEDEEDISPIDKKNFNSWAVTLGLGNVYTTGDLSSFGADQKSFDFGFNVGVTKMFNSSIGLEALFMMGKSNTHANSYYAGTGLPLDGDTETPFFTTNLNLVLNISNIILSGRDQKDRKWNFNLYPGFGMTFHKAYFTHASDPTQDQDWANNGSKTDQNTRVYSIPIGAGVKYRLSKTFDIELRETATYYNDSNFDGRDKAFGGGSNDYGFYTGISLVWKIGKKDRYLDWTNPLDEAYSEMSDLQSQVEDFGKDTDGDGVPDVHDIDNETPAGVMVAGNGRALDSDQDGVPDFKDVDPFTPLGAQVDEYGKELDSDKDGIGDSRDAEPNSAKGAIVNWQGVTIGGGGDMLSELIPSVFFKFDSAVLEKDSEDKLIIIAKIMQNNPDIKVDVVGYADQNGDPDYNKKLGARRAQTVIDFLSKTYGVDAGRMSAQTAGADKPLSTSKDYYKNNRRVDFVIK
jgi:OOP family OmpA-OmpF porin